MDPIIHTETNAYERNLELQNKAKNIVTNICETIAEDLPNVDLDYLQLFEHPAEYVILEWWKDNKNFFPNNADKAKAFSNVANTDLQELHTLVLQFQDVAKRMKAHKPTIEKNNIKWNVKKESFERRLDQKKKDHYNALNNFLESAKKLQEYEQGNGNLHLVRFSPNLQFQNMDAVINNYKFVKKQ